MNIKTQLKPYILIFFHINENLFNIFITIFTLISDKIQDENDIESANYSIILSQTFYKVEIEEKIMYIYH